MERPEDGTVGKKDSRDVKEGRKENEGKGRDRQKEGRDRVCVCVCVCVCVIRRQT